jgi:N-acetylglucosamine-6-phosphate deacetylase
VAEHSLKRFDALNKAAGGQILYETLAPEIKGAPKYIQGLVKRGVRVALGHHEGAAEDIDKAVDAGAAFCTHLGNGLSANINRHHNPLWPQLSNDGLTAALIADLHHLPVPALKTFVRAKGPGRVILTSDAVHIAGLEPGKYELGGMDVELTPQGRVCLTGTELLAGSALMLLHGIVNAAAYTDLTLAQAFASATTIPRKLLGVRQRPARPQAGRKADLICFRIEEQKDRPTESIDAVYIDGERTA